METFHIIEAKYLPFTNTKPARFLIQSARFQQRIIVSKEQFETGVDWCNAHGFNIVGTGYIKDRIIIASDTFKPLKKQK